MRGNWFCVLLLPAVLAVALAGCASNGVPPGIVYTSSAPGAGGPGAAPSNNAPYYGNGTGPYANGPYTGTGPYAGNAPYGGNGPYTGNGPYYGNGPYPNTTQVASAPAQGGYAGAPGDSGRVVSIHEVALQGGGGGGYGASQGTFAGGLIGAMTGATIGAITSQTLGGGVVGAVLGLVGGAIAGTIADGNRGYAARGIQVTVQKDDGQQVTVAQRDDGDIQLGDRVQIVQNSQGVAQVVRGPARTLD
jgi:outer membrane lipoprotein SlyB